MSEPRIVSREEAQEIERAARTELEQSGWTEQVVYDLAHTVAARPEQIELMAPLSDADLSALHRRHAFGTEGTCDGCREPFPCRVLRLVTQAMVARLGFGDGA